MSPLSLLLPARRPNCRPSKPINTTGDTRPTAEEEEEDDEPRTIAPAIKSMRNRSAGPRWRAACAGGGGWGWARRRRIWCAKRHMAREFRLARGMQKDDRYQRESADKVYCKYFIRETDLEWMEFQALVLFGSDSGKCPGKSRSIWHTLANVCLVGLRCRRRWTNHHFPAKFYWHHKPELNPFFEPATCVRHKLRFMDIPE